MNTRLNRLLPLASLGLALACVKQPRNKEGITDTTQLAPVVTSISVSRAGSGMSERISWIFSPDRRAVLVVADRVGVEAEPLPNGFVFGDEAAGFQLKMDSVWDVAVSPDWKSIAFSRAYSIADGAGRIDPANLADLARRTSIDTATLRASSFPSSSMSDARAIAQPGVARVPALPRNASAVDSSLPRMFPVARGWRVRWTSDGAIIALGNAPTRALDAEPSESWSALDPRTGEFHGSLPASARIVEPAMFAGPVIHGSMGADLSAAPPIKAVNNGRELTIVSERGVITVTATTPGDSSAANPHVIGSGVALAATAGGGYVIALAPKTKVQPGESPVEAVVYRINW